MSAILGLLKQRGFGSLTLRYSVHSTADTVAICRPKPVRLSGVLRLALGQCGRPATGDHRGKRTVETLRDPLTLDRDTSVDNGEDLNPETNLGLLGKALERVFNPTIAMSMHQSSN
jgi:hypothetical protein